MLHIRSLRFRVAATFIVGTIGVSGMVAGATYVLLSRQLTRDRVRAAEKQTWSRLAAMRGEIQAATAANRGITAGELKNRVENKSTVVVIGGLPDKPKAAWSKVSFQDKQVPTQLIDVVRKGQVGYAFVRGDQPLLVVGSQVPGSNGTGEAYFAYSMGSVVRTLGLLRKVFVALIALTALVAGLVGLRLAVATIRPLRLAAVAARRVADGNLETRLTVSGSDELARLATAFNDMAVALEERINRERRFVADVSHELRTPLTTLKTSIDFIAERADELPTKMQAPIGLAAEEVRSLQRLVDDLLELSRVDAGGIVAANEEVDLMNFANELKRRRAPSAEVTISGPDELVVHTDKMRLERVVGNLLENAVFHGGDGGVEISVGAIDGLASIVVSDGGPGIDPEKLPHIFDRFWRGDASRRRDGRIGSGLGLSIARENALVIGAHIDVDSIPGEGTRFEVTLPVGVET